MTKDGNKATASVPMKTRNSLALRFTSAEKTQFLYRI